MVVTGNDVFRRILDSSPDLVSVVDRFGVLRYVNATHRVLLGLDPAALVGTSALDLVHPEDRPLAALGLRDLYSGEGEAGTGVAMRLRTSDGRWVLYEVAGSFVHGDDDDPETVLVTRPVSGNTISTQSEIDRLTAMLRARNDASPDGVLMVTPGAEVVSYNQKFLDLWGLTPEEVASTEARRAKMTPQTEHTEAGLELVRTAYESPRGTFDSVIELVDGRFIDIHTAPLIGSGDEVYGRAWYYRDVSERINAQCELQKSEERYRRLVELSPNAIGVHQNGILRYVNAAALRLLNMQREEVIGQNVFTFLHPDDVPTVISAAMEPDFEAPRFVEARLRRPDGKELIVEVASSGTTLGAERATQTVIRDLTESRLAERARRESDERYRNLVESAPDAIYVTAGGRITYANQAAAALLGFSQPSEVLGLNPFDLIGGVGREEYQSRLARVMAGETLRFAERYFLVYAGREADLEIAFAPATIQGEPAAQAIVRDVTERRREAEQRLALERRMLETQKLESLGVLAGGIAHDFNNLLVAIMGNAGLALLETTPESPIAEYLHEIETASQRAADLARQMLAYSGKGKFVLERLDLNTVVREMANLLAVSMPKTADVQFRLDDSLPPIEADPTQVRQVVMNVVINAAEALGDQPGAITVATGTVESVPDDVGAKSGRFVSFRVTDTGCGMDAATQSRIFDPFFTTKFTGRGLGLASVMGIVRGHGGTVRIDSEVGRGTTFEVLLPAADIGGLKDPAVPPTPRGASYTGTALVVDDEAPVLRVAEGMLRRLGFETASVANGQQALDWLAANPAPALLLVDVLMPGMGGEHLVRDLRESGLNVPAILMSGYSEQGTVGRVGPGGSHFLQKPFTFQELADAVASSLATASAG